MIEKRDIEAAIAECLGKRNPDASTCIKLAAFYTIQHELFGEPVVANNVQAGYSYAPAPVSADPPKITIDSGSEFARLIDGRAQTDVWPVMDELMDTLHDMQPRLYYMVMDRLR